MAHESLRFGHLHNGLLSFFFVSLGGVVVFFLHTSAFFSDKKKISYEEKNFFMNFGQALRGAGFESAEDVFQRVAQGLVPVRDVTEIAFSPCCAVWDAKSEGFGTVVSDPGGVS